MRIFAKSEKKKPLKSESSDSKKKGGKEGKKSRQRITEAFAALKRLLEKLLECESSDPSKKKMESEEKKKEEEEWEWDLQQITDDIEEGAILGGVIFFVGGCVAGLLLCGPVGMFAGAIAGGIAGALVGALLGAVMGSIDLELNHEIRMMNRS